MAAGLGKLTVTSGLGQPLRAEIEVVALQRGEAESLAAKIASPEAFREAGVEYGIAVPRVRSALERRGDRYVIVLSTLQPVEEPFIDLLVELNWAAGRLVRQYTFLLDPAEYKGPQPIAAAPPKPAAPQVSAVETPKPPAVTEVPAPATPIAQPAAPAAPVPPAQQRTELVEPPPGAETYQVKQGDTLGKIAQQYKPEGVSMQQMLVALYRANEDAFINKNMNLLRSGRILSVPDKAAAETVAAPDANRIVAAQTQDFNEYRAKLSAAVAAAPAPGNEGRQRTAGRITEKPQDGAGAKAAPGDQLRVTKADDAAKGGKAAATARSDDLAARERALKEANDRVADLEKNVKDLQKLVELKNQQLAELQKQAQAAKAAPAPKAGEPAKAAEAPKPVEPPKPAEIATAPSAAPAPKPEAPAAKAPEAPQAEPTPAPAEKAPVAAEPTEKPAAPPVGEAPKAPAPVAEAPKAAPPAAKKPAQPQPREPSFIEAFLDDPLYPAGVGGGLLAVLAAGYLWRRKKSAKLENSLLGASTADSSSVFGTTGGRSVDTGSSSLQTDFSQGGIGAIDTDEVDPVAEADVYMAYGRDAQAEEILKEALQKDPNRQAVRVKLLEIYAARKDLKAFETTAGEIYAATGGQGPEWQKAVELGLQTDPTNPMYGGKAAQAGGTGVPETVTLAAAAGATATAVASPTDIAFDLGNEHTASVDFDLDAGAKHGETTPDISLDVMSQAPSDLGFDLNLGDSEKPADEATDFSPSGTFIMDDAMKKAVSEMVEAQGKAGAMKIDFELPGTPATGSGFDDEPKMTMSQKQAAAAFDFKLDEPTVKPAGGPVDLSGISFDLGTSGVQSPAAVDTHWQEVATKLDLAKAYEEMGDRDGARELLNEVVKEGDAAQQQQAKQLLEALH